MPIDISSSVDLDDLAWQLSRQLSPEEILNFIVDLDGFMADWDFTVALYRWATAQHAEYIAEGEDIQREMTDVQVRSDYL